MQQHREELVQWPVGDWNLLPEKRWLEERFLVISKYQCYWRREVIRPPMNPFPFLSLGLWKLSMWVRLSNTAASGILWCRLTLTYFANCNSSNNFSEPQEPREGPLWGVLCVTVLPWPLLLWGCVVLVASSLSSSWPLWSWFTFHGFLAWLAAPDILTSETSIGWCTLCLAFQRWLLGSTMLLWLELMGPVALFMSCHKACPFPFTSWEHRFTLSSPYTSWLLGCFYLLVSGIECRSLCMLDRTHNLH